MASLGGGIEHRPQAARLIQAAVFAALVALSTCMTGSHMCPRSLDCARAGRHFCQPGDSSCGPCLSPLVDNSRGRCVVKRRHAPRVGKVATFPELDEEIDFLSAIISQRQETDIQLQGSLALPSVHTRHCIRLAAPRKPVPASHLPRMTPGPRACLRSRRVRLTRSLFRLPAAPPRDASETKEEPKPQSASRGPTAEPPATLGGPSAPRNGTASPTTTSQAPSGGGGPVIVPITAPYPSDEHVFLIMTSVFIVVGSLALIIAGVCWIRLQKGVRLAQKIDYPAYGGMGPQSYDNNVPGDKKLARSAQMYHYQHQKQQMLSLGKHRDEPKVPDSGATSDEENEDGDFTVYECPGLAPTGEMEVKNPLFDDSPLYFQRTHK
ncbi:neural proliferation differentiation and control protein 1 [Osmerus eperlanus]|uniref:neural proliferation differentiation and control protein 1 n=1 Tax=Osmerus eperlanus TaxID=29151 RepID=UPI002E12F7C7